MYVNTKLLIKSLQYHMQWSLITGEDINLLWCTRAASALGQQVAHAAVTAETAGAWRLGWNKQGDIYLHD